MDMPHTTESASLDPLLRGWTTGPLPHQELEQAALELFGDRHWPWLWAEDGYSEERHRYRQQVARVCHRRAAIETQKFPAVSA